MPGNISVLGNEDLLQNILSRIPALSFASAACVNKSWNKVCNRILSRPKLASALSLSHPVDVAVSEVLNEVLSEPIRPHFAIAFVGLQFNLALAHHRITRRLGSRTPIVTNASAGIIGVDARTNELNEVKWKVLDQIGPGNYEPINFHSDVVDRCGIVLVVGFVPGLKVDTIPLLRPKMGPNVAMVDKFMMDIRHYTASVSGCTSPDAIILVGDQYVDLKPVLAEMDYGLPEETVIVGDARGRFFFKTEDNSQNYYRNFYFFDAVALVFAREKDKSDVTGEIQFNVTMSTGVLPFGPKLKAVSVKVHNANCSRFTAKMEGEHEVVDSKGLLEDIKDQIEDEHPCLYIGVTHRRECSIGSHRSGPKSNVTLYEVLAGEKEHFVINGVGLKPGDTFVFYHSDSDTASCSCDHVFEDLKILKTASSSSSSSSRRNNKEVFGGLIFSCFSRKGILFGHHDEDYVESVPFHKNFPGIPLAGVFCSGEIGRGGRFTSKIIEEEEEEEDDDDDEEDGSILGQCLLHYYSTVYLVMSYTPPPHQP